VSYCRCTDFDPDTRVLAIISFDLKQFVHASQRLGMKEPLVWKSLRMYIKCSGLFFSFSSYCVFLGL